jgi:hypothetical protein
VPPWIDRFEPRGSPKNTIFAGCRPLRQFAGQTRRRASVHIPFAA